jgi:hypothetical protein
MNLFTKSFFLILIVFISLGCALTQTLSDPTPTVRASDTPAVFTTTPEEPTKTPTEASPTDTPEYAPELNSENFREENETPKYIIEITFPSLVGVPDSEILNQGIADLLELEMDAFKTMAQDNEEWRAANMPEIGNDMYVDYIVVIDQKGLISILFTISTYTAGAAHPFSFSRTVNYNVSEEHFIELAELFFPGTNYLELLSDLCLSRLRDSGIDPWEEGALPIVENYRNWNIQDDGLLITFDVYQVAPYAAGPQRVLIPYQELRESIPPGGLLARFLD